MRHEKITFENAEGQNLSARLDLPVDGPPIAYALFAHCFTCTKNLKAVGNISAALTAEGIAVLRFDFTGLGESEGNFADTNFSSNIEDLVEAARYLDAHYAAPTLMVGHSLGGAAVLQAAAQVSAVRAVATIGAPYDPEHVTHLFDEARDRIEEEGVAEVRLAGRPFTIKKQFLDDLAAQRVQANLRSLGRALMIFHSPIDETVGVENARLIFEAARHPKSFVSLDQADHLLMDEADSRYVGRVLAAWAQKYLGATLPETRAEPVDDRRIAVRIDRQRFRTEVLANGHSLVADEPVAVGGQNLGPTPYDLLVAALGTCTAITLRMYADHKGWPLETAVVRLLHQKVHLNDSQDGGERGKKIDRIERELELIGDLTDEQLARLQEVADRCPVHRTLTHGTIEVVRRQPQATEERP